MVLDEEHGEVALLTEPQQEVTEHRHLLVAQSTGRLVEQQQTRLRDQSARELDALQRRVGEA